MHNPRGPFWMSQDVLDHVDYLFEKNVERNVKDMCLRKRPWRLIGWLACRLFKRHSPEREPAFDGVSLTARCRYCGEPLLPDDQGKWEIGGRGMPPRFSVRK